MVSHNFFLFKQLFARNTNDSQSGTSNRAPVPDNNSLTVIFFSLIS